MIYVIGDSHSRSFSKNENFFPLFIGAGKQNCFISDENLNHVKNGFEKAVSVLPSKSDVLIVLGEPDTRFYLGKGWTPWEVEGEDNVEDVDAKISFSGSRFITFVKWLRENYSHNFYLLSVTPSLRENQNVYVRSLNSYLRNECLTHGFDFVDIEDQLFEERYKVKPDFVGDEVHLNNKIQLLVEPIFLKKKLIATSRFNTNSNFDSQEIQRSFTFNEKFSCYVFQPPAQKKSFFRKAGSAFRAMLRGEK